MCEWEDRVGETTTEVKPYQKFIEGVRATALAVEDIEGLLQDPAVYVRMHSWRANLVLWPAGEGEESGFATARRIYGWLETRGWKPSVEKKSYHNGVEYMYVIFTKMLIGLEAAVELEGWMAKTCRIVNEEVVIPAEPAKEATPERREMRRRIVCENG